MSPVDALQAVLAQTPRRVIACSGGIDSLLLADIAHEEAPDSTVVAHSVTPAVPPSATARVQQAARTLGWVLQLVTSAEFEDPSYLSNPVDRCYFCKSNLYSELDRIIAARPLKDEWVLMSGTNTDDQGEYRPGLIAADEHAVRHPYLDAGLGKSDVRSLARERGRSWHSLAAAPCLASRLYTGTPVTPAVLRAIDRGEEHLRAATGLPVLRCRVEADHVRVEVPAGDRRAVTDQRLNETMHIMRSEHPDLRTIRLDDAPYAPGRALRLLDLAPGANSIRS